MAQLKNNPITLDNTTKLFGVHNQVPGEVAPGFLGVHNLLHVQDQKTQNTPGGTFTLGAWRTRDLNTVVVNNITTAALAANKVTIPAGTYYIDAVAEAYAVGVHRMAIYETTLGAVLRSRSHFVSPTAYAQNSARMSGFVTFEATAELSLQHISAATQTNTGFGCAGNFAVEIYADLKIWKIA